MSEKPGFRARLFNWVSQIDWALLLFLAGATYVKLYVKVAAVLCYSIWLIIKKAEWKKPPPPVLFYVAMPILGIIVAGLYGSFERNGYSVGAALGLTQWLTGGTILYLLYVAIRNTDNERTGSTAKAFFALSALTTFIQFVGLIIDSKHLMPYWFYDSGLKYGASTGDRLTGIFMNNSLNNAAVMLIGLLFFFFRGERPWAIMCLIVILMCTSNVVTFGMLAIFFLLLIAKSGKRTRVNIVLLVLLTIVLYPTLSPQNFGYIRTVMGRLTAKSKPFIAPKNPVGDTILSSRDSLRLAANGPQRSLSLRVDESMYRRMPEELVALREYSKHMPKPAWSYLVIEPDALRPYFKKWYGISADSTLLSQYGKPAKIFAARQTIGFLNTSTRYWLAGAGMGNFSSKLAIKMTGLPWQGSFPDSKINIARPFLEYHFYTLTYVFSRDIQEHSVINMPGTTYLQILGEYGIIGLLLFVVLYLIWFWKRCKDYKPGRWMLVALLGIFWLDYWYEMMTLTVVIEFCMMYGIFARPRTDA
jgi:hypothetical protein